MVSQPLIIVRSAMCSLLVASVAGCGDQIPAAGQVDAEVAPTKGDATGGAKAGDAAISASNAMSTGGTSSKTTEAGSSATGGSQQSDGSDAAVVGDASLQDASASSNGTGPGDWAAGDYPEGLTDLTYLEMSGLAGQAGNVRQYKVHVPPNYDPNTPTPTVFCIHGLAQDPIMFCVNGADWVGKSDDEGFILIMPLGYQNSWNAGTCCGGASTAQLDDVGFFRALIDEVGSHLNIDLDRVYASGLSNGGYMSYRLACDAADVFAAVAPGAGGIGINDFGTGTNIASDFTECAPGRPISVLDIHGDADPLVPYSLQAPSLDIMVQNANCMPSSEPATDPKSGGDTTCVSYPGCDDNVEIIGCTISGGGHCWFGGPDCGTGGGAIGAAVVGANSDTMKNTDAAWNFLRRHSLQ